MARRFVTLSELGAIAHIHTASEELTDEFSLFAINSGLLQGWAEGFPDPRQEAEIRMKVILAASLAARFAGIHSLRKLGYVLQSAQVLGALGYSVAVSRGCHGVVRTMRRSPVAMCCAKLLVQMETRIKVVGARNYRYAGGARAPAAPGGPPKALSTRATSGAWASCCRAASHVVHRDAGLAYRQLGERTTVHIVDCTKVEVPLDSGHYECSGVVKRW